MIDTIIDLSHYNSCDMTKVSEAGIIAVIHKATQGTGFTDPEFLTRRQQAKDLGLLWGSYHFCDGTDVMDQMENFLGVVGPDFSDFIALDFEPNPGGLTITLAQLEEFVSLIDNELGFYPVLYGGYLIRQSIGASPNPTLANCPLWYARYSSQPVGIPYQVWSSYALWQFTDGAWGNPLPVDGVGRCDRNNFDGTQEQLKSLWPFHN